jgi:integrase
VPSWNLALVLQALTQAPLEPLKDASLKLLTLKTIFLIALASGKRRSELHALRADTLLRDEHWHSVTLQPDPTFVSKTDLANKGVAVVTAFTINSLKGKLGRSMSADRSLCPVRALKHYWQRTADLRKDSSRLFISFKKGFSGDIAKNTISFWIRKAILLAYEHASPDTTQLFSVKAHDVRAMASSWAFLRNVSLDNIMNACSWRTHSTFTHHYLRDLTLISGDLLKLGPIVAAQHTV